MHFSASALATIQESLDALDMLDALREARPTNLVNAAHAEGLVPGAHFCETVGFFEIVSPGATNLGPEDLADLFAHDDVPQDLFWHPYFGFDEDGELADQPLFTALDDEMLEMQAKHVPHGVAAYADSARHIAFARSEKTGEIAAFIDFSLVFTPRALDEQAVLADPSVAYAMDVALCIHQLFTLSSMRGQGAAAALMEFAGYVFQHEVETLLYRFCPQAELVNECFVIRPFVHVSDDSHCALMVEGLMQDTVNTCVSMIHTSPLLPVDNFQFEAEFLD